MNGDASMTPACRWDCQIALGKTKTRQTAAGRRSARGRVELAIRSRTMMTKMTKITIPIVKPRDDGQIDAPLEFDLTRLVDRIQLAIERAVDAALGEVARQQGSSIAGTIGLEARRDGILAASPVVQWIEGEIRRLFRVDEGA